MEKFKKLLNFLGAVLSAALLFFGLLIFGMMISLKITVDGEISVLMLLLTFALCVGFFAAVYFLQRENKRYMIFSGASIFLAGMSFLSVVRTPAQGTEEITAQTGICFYVLAVVLATAGVALLASGIYEAYKISNENGVKTKSVLNRFKRL